MASGGEYHDQPLFFFHIPKTGGASVVASAKTMLGPHAMGIYDTVIGPGGNAGLSNRVRRLLRSRDLRFMHAHASPSALSPDLNVQRAITMRDPLDRLLSHFCYCHLHRHADPGQFRFFSRPNLIHRRSFDAADVAEWARHFEIDNYMTRYLIGQIAGPIGAAEGAAARELLNGMRYIGITRNLNAFFGDIGVAMTGRPLPAFHANASDRSVVRLTEAESTALADSFLTIDQALFEEATRRAAALPQATPSKSAWVASGGARNPSLLRRLRYRTGAELGTVLSAMIARRWRKVLEFVSFLFSRPAISSPASANAVPQRKPQIPSV